MPRRLILSPLPGHARQRARYELVEPYELRLWFGRTLDGVTVTVPRGTVTDFATVPRWLWWLYPPDGPWASAAVVHDYLYQLGAESGERSQRALADAIFRAAMEAAGVPAWRATILYYAVRLFGARHFGRQT